MYSNHQVGSDLGFSHVYGRTLVEFDQKCKSTMEMERESERRFEAGEMATRVQSRRIATCCTNLIRVVLSPISDQKSIPQRGRYCNKYNTHHKLIQCPPSPRFRPSFAQFASFGLTVKVTILAPHM